MDVQLMNAGSTSSQKIGGRIDLSSPNAATTGTGDLGTFVGNQNDTVGSAIYGTSAQDTTANKTTAISLTQGGAIASETFNKWS